MSVFWENSNGEINILHVFEDIFNYENSTATFKYSNHLVCFELERLVETNGVVIPNYYPVGEIVFQILTVNFGKLLLPAGFLQSQGNYCVPNYIDVRRFNKSKDYYSGIPRNEFPIE